MENQTWARVLSMRQYYAFFPELGRPQHPVWGSVHNKGSLDHGRATLAVSVLCLRVSFSTPTPYLLCHRAVKQISGVRSTLETSLPRMRS